MQWLLALEIDNDPISLCRLMNNFRRKGIRVAAFWLAASNSAFDAMAVVETSESEVDHLYHFLRRSEGVEHVSAYLPVSVQDELESDVVQNANAVSYIFVKSGSGILESLPAENFAGLKVAFASQGMLLLELLGEGRERLPDVIGAMRGGLEFVHFAHMKTTHSQAVSELVA